MTTTDELIRHLAADVIPLRQGAVLRRLAAGIAVGALAAWAALTTVLGPPLQAVPATGAAAFTMKLLFSVTLFAAAFALLFIAGRPGRSVGNRWLWLLPPIAVVAVSAAMELSIAGPSARDELWLGSTWQTCLLAIALLSVPIFAGVIWAFQWLAPTRLRLAGLLAGLTAGSAAAILYALYCPETTATFLLSWYSLGILASGLVGSLAGPRLLSW
ncbi:MAG: NrsF family protein [Alphaproteobacteria bacterium]